MFQISECRDKFINHARRSGVSIHDAEDAFSEATVKYLSQRRGMIRKPKSWLFSTYRREIANLIRKRKAYREVPELSDSPYDSTSSDVRAEAVELIDAVPASLLREALKLRYLYGMSCSEGAAETGCSVSAFRTRLSRGRAVISAHA